MQVYNNNNNNNNNNNFISRGQHIWHECQSNIWSSLLRMTCTIVNIQQTDVKTYKQMLAIRRTLKHIDKCTQY